jgi:hypothetical protein
MSDGELAFAQMSDAEKAREGSGWIEGIDRRLEVMSTAPLVLSTPVGLLAENRITDKKVLFVRNIQDMAEGMTMEPLPLTGWEIELVGLGFDRPRAKLAACEVRGTRESLCLVSVDDAGQAQAWLL